LRESESMWASEGGGAEGEGERNSNRLCAQRRTQRRAQSCDPWGHDLSWNPRIGRLTVCATQAHRHFPFFMLEASWPFCGREVLQGLGRVQQKLLGLCVWLGRSHSLRPFLRGSRASGRAGGGGAEVGTASPPLPHCALSCAGGGPRPGATPGGFWAVGFPPARWGAARAALVRLRGARLLTGQLGRAW